MNNKFDIVLVRPPHGEKKPQFDFFPDEHLGLTYISAYVKQKGKKSLVIDCHFLRLTRTEFLHKMEEIQTDLIGFTVFQPDIAEVGLLSQKLKEKNPNLKIVIGGQFPTFEWQDIMAQFPYIDFITLYEGEEPTFKLIEYLEGKIPIEEVPNLVYRKNGKVYKNKILPLMDLATLPFPDRNYNLNLTPVIGIISSKGCYANCSYCGVRKFYQEPLGPSLRFRPIQHVLDEIEYIYKNHNRRGFVFWDDNFLLPGKLGEKRIEEFCEGIKKRNLKIHFGFETRVDNIDKKKLKKLIEVGLKYIFLGVESAHPDSLAIFNKKTTPQQNWQALEICGELNLLTLCAFIMYEPYSTVEKIKTNIQFLRKAFSTFPNLIYYPFAFTRLDPLRGTQIYKRLKEEGRLKIRKNWYEFKIEGDLYEIVDKRIEDLFSITEILDRETGEISLSFWRLISLFDELKNLSRTPFFRKMLQNLKKSTNQLEKQFFFFKLNQLEKGLDFVQTPNYKLKLEEYKTNLLDQIEIEKEKILEQLSFVEKEELITLTN